jgi:hypothetical protein
VSINNSISSCLHCAVGTQAHVSGADGRVDRCFSDRIETRHSQMAVEGKSTLRLRLDKERILTPLSEKRSMPKSGKYKPQRRIDDQPEYKIVAKDPVVHKADR